jgi:hypothetical protein
VDLENPTFWAVRMVSANRHHRFPREADNDVGGDGGAVEDGVNLANNTEKVVSGVLATHFSENCRAAGLQGQVKMGHNIGIFGKTLQQAVGDIGRFKGLRRMRARPEWRQLIEQLAR